MFPRIVKLLREDPLPMSLLLLADETVEAIERYIFRCEVHMLVLDHVGPVGVFAIHHNNPEEIELKNMAVNETFQGRGLGGFMLGEIHRIAVQGGYGKILVGTATVGRQIDFYLKNGFSPCGLRRNFFLDNYPDPIFENGQRLCDMLLLEMKVRPTIEKGGA